MKESDLKSIIRPFMAKYGYECLTEKGTIRQQLKKLSQENKAEYNRYLGKLPSHWPILLKYDYEAAIPYKPVDVAQVDDLFYGRDIIKYTFRGCSSPFQDEPCELPPGHIILEYKTEMKWATDVRFAIGQTLCYQVEFNLPTYLVLPFDNYEYAASIFYRLPIGVITYDDKGNIIVIQNTTSLFIPRK